MSVEVKRFINHIFKPNAPICISFGLDSKYGKPSSQHFLNNDKSIDEMIQMAQLGQKYDPCGVFFTVNQTDGKWRCAENITAINCLFAEFDYSSNNHDELIQRLNTLPIPPTAIVKSKNGPHVYWKVSDITVEEFAKYQDHLYGWLISNGLNPDPASRNLARILRMPGFYHMKQIMEPFMVVLAKCEDKSYSKSELTSLLRYEYSVVKSETSSKKLRRLNTKSIPTNVSPISISYNNIIYNNINNIYNKYKSKFYNKSYIYNMCKNIVIKKDSSLVSCFKKNKYYFTFDNFIKYIKQEINVAEFVGGNTNRCFFHEDKKDSMSYFKGASGDYMYHCFSPNCDTGAMNNLQLLAKLCRISVKEVINAFKKGLNVNTSGKHLDMVKDVVEFNLKALDEVAKGSKFTEIKKMLKRHGEKIEFLLSYQEDRACSEKLAHNNKPLVFLSCRYFASQFGKMDKGTANKIFNFMAMVGFINKVQHELLNDIVRKEALGLQARMEKRMQKGVRVISYYTLSRYTESVLRDIESKLRKARKQGVDMFEMSLPNVEYKINEQELKTVFFIPKPAEVSEISKKEVERLLSDEQKKYFEALFRLDYSGDWFENEFPGTLTEYFELMFSRGSPVKEMACSV